VVAAIRARLRAGVLDAALAAGADPDGSAALCERARQLTRPAFRASLAERLERSAPSHASRRWPGWSGHSSAILIPPALAGEAGPAMRRLADELRTAQAPRPRGVAMALRMVTDVTSPLYTGPVDEVVRCLEDAREALSGEL
jgi:hypothetical protein